MKEAPANVIILNRVWTDHPVSSPAAALLTAWFLLLWRGVLGGHPTTPAFSGTSRALSTLTLRHYTDFAWHLLIPSTPTIWGMVEEGSPLGCRSQRPVTGVVLPVRTLLPARCLAALPGPFI